MLTHPLLPKLKALKLSGMSLTLETRAGQASQEQLSPVEFLALLLDDELERRQQHRLQRVLGESGVDPSKSLAQFDFSAAAVESSGRGAGQWWIHCRWRELR